MTNNNASVTIYSFVSMRTCIVSQKAEVFSEYKNQEYMVESVIHKHLLAIFYIYPLYVIKILLFRLFQAQMQ